MMSDSKPESRPRKGLPMAASQRTLYLLMWERWGIHGLLCPESPRSLSAQTGATIRTMRRARKAWIKAGWAREVESSITHHAVLQMLHRPTYWRADQ
jgi:hypothetical protein